VARSLSPRGRIVLAYLALAAVGGAALGAFIVLVERPGPKPPTPWSAWKPSTASLGGTAQAIAAHVGGTYRRGDGRQLARIVLDAPPPAAANVEAIALANGSALRALYDPGKTILYTLCGKQRNCALGGSGTIGRGDALRRETLELALYTLKYTHSDGVGVFFPPSTSDQITTNIFFFTRDDLKRQLDRPLRHTLPRPSPPAPGRIDSRELQAIDELTGGHRYHFGVQTADGGRKVLVLQPVA
jgi:hypothetical protein